MNSDPLNEFFNFFKEHSKSVDLSVVTRQLLRVNIIRYYFCLFRYFLYSSLRRVATVKLREGDYIHREPCEKGVDTIKHNLDGLHDLAGTRTSRLVKPLSCIEHLRPKYKCPEDHMSIIEDIERNVSPDILIVGPRTEGELFLFYAYGFDLSNIEAIDLISYSPLIKLANMHNLDYPSNSFDVIQCSCCLVYSEDPQIALKELYRVAKPECYFSIMADVSENTHKEHIEKWGYSIAKLNDVLNLIVKEGDNVEIIWNHYDDKLNSMPLGATSSFIFKLNKSTTNQVTV